MRLDRIIAGAPAGAGNPDITGLAYDTRTVEPGTLFFCVPGFSRDGHDFAPEAIARGAVALVVERPLHLSVPEIRVQSVRAAMAPAAAAFYGDPTNTLQTVGVTGTNGKTTTAFLVRALLEAARAPDRSARHGQERDRRRRAPRGADHARGDRPPAHVSRDARRRRRGLLDGGVLARARAASGRRDPLRGGDLHQPDAGPSRLPRHDGGVLLGQAAAIRGRPGTVCGDQRR